jgi:hypothetical protein
LGHNFYKKELKKMTIEEVLYNYKNWIAKKNYLEIELTNINETIEEICIPATILSDMPRTITNKITSKVENAVEKIEKLNINEIQIKIKKINKQIQKIENALNFLAPLEKIIIIERYVNLKSWDYVAKQYAIEANFDWISIKTIKRKKNVILEKVKPFLIDHI